MKETMAAEIVAVITKMRTLIFGTALLDPLGVVEVKGRVNRQWRLIFRPNMTPEMAAVKHRAVPSTTETSTYLL
jgi:hypothetical protein